MAIARRTLLPDLFASFWPEEAMFTPERVFSRLSMRVEEGFAADGSWVVKAELPGIDPDKDVEISITDGMLTIDGIRREEKKEDSAEGYRTEFRYGEFRRVLALPAGAKETEIAASYHDGILEVRVPIGEEKQSVTRIPVQRR